MFERKPRYRNARLKAGRDKTVLRCGLVSAAPVPTNKPHPQFLIIVFHHKVSTYFGGHLMHHSTQQQKVRGNSRLRRIRVLKDELLRRTPGGREKAKPPFVGQCDDGTNPCPTA